MAHPIDETEPPVLLPAAWLKFGQRNLLYIAFVTLLLPLGLALDGPRPPGVPTLGGLGFALHISLWASAVFLAVNLVLLLSGFTKARPIVKPLIGCALPLLCGGAGLLIATL